MNSIDGAGRPHRAGGPRVTMPALLTGAISWLMIIMMSIPGDLDYYSRGTMDGGDANPVTRTLWLVIFAVSLMIMLSRLRATFALLRRIDIFFLLFAFLATASLFWSIDPEQTGRRLVRLLIICSACLSIAVVGWSPRRFQQVVRPPVTLLLLGSIIFCLWRPDLAIHHDPEPELFNAWHGLFPTKNALGAVAAYGFVLWAHAWISREQNRIRALIGAAVAAVCLVMSRSDTSIIATVLTVLALLLLMRTPGSMRRSVPWLSTALIVLILVYSLAMLKVIPGLEILLSPIPMITGKDLTFSNRAAIWAAVVDHIQFRPLLGSGYSAYWRMGTVTPDMESYAVISKLDGFYPGSAHNGYLQVLNDLGAAGLIVLLGYIAVYFRQALRLYIVDRSQGALFLALLLQQATINLSEPLWLNVLLVDFVIMSIATTCLGRALLEVERAPPAVPRSALRSTTGRGREQYRVGRLPWHRDSQIRR